MVDSSWCGRQREEAKDETVWVRVGVPMVTRIVTVMLQLA